jgi:hypothetical protein
MSSNSIPAYQPLPPPNLIKTFGSSNSLPSNNDIPKLLYTRLSSSYSAYSNTGTLKHQPQSYSSPTLEHTEQLYERDVRDLKLIKRIRNTESAQRYCNDLISNRSRLRRKQELVSLTSENTLLRRDCHALSTRCEAIEMALSEYMSLYQIEQLKSLKSCS